MRKDAQQPETPPWRLRADILSTHALLWVAGAGRSGDPLPEVHLYLYDRYWRLSEYHASHGRQVKASKLRRKAEEHYRASGHDGPPFAAAISMSVPRPSVFTRAVSSAHQGNGDDAA